MNYFPKFAIIPAVLVAAMAPAIGASSDARHDSHHPAVSATVQLAQAAPAAPAASAAGMGMGMARGAMTGMPGHADQMKAMQAMHDRMMAAKTPEERNALMAEHMQVMHKGMGMMGRMGPGAMQGATPGKPSDMGARQNMMEQRMDMMQSMMQMMMDRMPAAPAK